MPGSTIDDEGVEWVLLSCPHSGTQWEDTVKYCYGGGQAPIPVWKGPAALSAKGSYWRERREGREGKDQES